jgi:hypothetical protein
MNIVIGRGIVAIHKLNRRVDLPQQSMQFVLAGQDNLSAAFNEPWQIAGVLNRIAESLLGGEKNSLSM